jgi:hypothetical protein
MKIYFNKVKIKTLNQKNVLFINFLKIFNPENQNEN